MISYDKGCESWPKSDVASVTGVCTCFCGEKG